MIVEQFLGWMQTAPLEARCRATAALARSFLVSDIDDHDREALEATLTVLLDEPQPEIRRVIAETMAPSKDAPRHLILALAEGTPEIAAIVLQQSPVLIEAELVDFLAEGTLSSQVAIASRAWLSPGISAAIAEVGELEACVALARNPTASIPVASLLKLADRLGRDGELREAMLARAHLPIEVRHTLMTQLSVALADLAIDRNWMRQERAVSASLDAKDKTTVQMAAAASTTELPELVEHLRSTGQLTTTLLLRAVTLGDVRFLQQALTLLSGLPAKRVEGLIIEGRESACRALLAKAGLPPRVFPAFIAALDVQRELARELGLQTPALADDHRFAARVVERVLTRCRETSVNEQDDLIVLLRRFATEAARDAARSLVANLTRQPPLMLPAPEPAQVLEEVQFADDLWTGDEIIEDAAFEAALIEHVSYVDIRLYPDVVEEDDIITFPVYPEIRPEMRAA
jgi:uncharacterized protein (DUF2336 family)